MLSLNDCPPTDLGAIEPNDLVRRARGGCADSFTELSRRFRPRLVCLVERRLGGGRGDAEDVAQEALVRAFERLDQFDPRYRFSTWLYTIAIRMAHDHARSRRRRPQLAVLDETNCLAPTAEIGRAAEAREEATNVWQLAKRVLSEPQFTAMWLRYGEDLSAADVAQVMGRSRIGVRVLLHRARTRLIAELAPQELATGQRAAGGRTE
jgi:RNA polymerase sigma-70 factor (ECF subfamily)